MKLIVLPLDYWMTDHFFYDDDVVERLPVYHKNAVFVSGNDWWFEINGRAFTYDEECKILNAIKQVKFTLEVSDECILRETDAKALEALIHFSKDAILKKRVRKILSNHHDASQIRNTGRMARKRFLARS